MNTPSNIRAFVNNLTKEKKMRLFPALIMLALLGAISCSKTQNEPAPASTSTNATIPYPLNTCIVSGEELGAMGKPVTLIYEGQEIKFCCSDCKPKFEKNPQEYLAKLTAADANKKPVEGGTPVPTP